MSPKTIPLAISAASLLLASCSHYATVREKTPLYTAMTEPGKLLTAALSGKVRSPLARLGASLDAAAHAERLLRSRPRDESVLKDYGFAVTRVFQAIHDGKMTPWNAPVTAPGADGPWTVSFPLSGPAGITPDKFHILPSDRYVITGTYVKTRTVKEGVGAPLVLKSLGENFLTVDPFAPGKRVYYGMTGLVRFDGRKAVLSIADPMSTENVQLAGRQFPMAGDFTAPLALSLANSNAKKLELARLLRPQKYANTAQLAHMQPYDRNKIPVVCVHGLMDSPATWAPMINTLRADPAFRRKYQFWFYSYPSGYPYPYSAAILRERLDDLNRLHPEHKKVVLIGHSMGGIISRTMITDSGMKLWDAHFTRPPAEAPLSEHARRILTGALIFKPRPEVARVIFIAAPHRGAEMAAGWIGKLGAKLVKGPQLLNQIMSEARNVLTLDTAAMNLKRMPNSIDTLSPNNKFVKTINTIPTKPGVPYHSIIGDRGKGGNKDRTKPQSSDGFVPYWSSHLDKAASERVVPSNHSAHQNEEAIQEVLRILKQHAN